MAPPTLAILPQALTDNNAHVTIERPAETNYLPEAIDDRTQDGNYSTWDEKIVVDVEADINHCNPVVESAQFVYDKVNFVKLNVDGIKSAAKFIQHRLSAESYTPSTWRTHPLHLVPPVHYSASDPRTRATLDWVFLVSALNFSFWSEREGRPDRYGVEWRDGWGLERRRVWTGYWSLVAALNRALEEGIPITTPAFYASATECPDTLIKHVFRAVPQSAESVPLLRERIAVMREMGYILCAGFGGSYQGFLDEFQRRHDDKGTALQLVKMVAEAFPSFRDETWCEGRRVFFWKRAQIIVAETWAAFYPSTSTAHPLFPAGAAIHELTMFADYRVPQLLHHLRILSYPPLLRAALAAHTPFASGSREEMSIRAASVLAVEAIRAEMLSGGGILNIDEVSSVLIDFYLWDLAKKVERGEDAIEGIETEQMLPAHRTRSIWY